MTGCLAAETDCRARRAGVRAGTVYRHFPTTTDLLEAVVPQWVDALTAMVAARVADPDPGAAFFAVCAEVVATAPDHLALCELVQSDDGWPKTLLHGAVERFLRALGELSVVAQRQGAVRADRTVADVRDLFTGCVAVQRHRGVDAEPVRAVALILGSMRASAAAGGPRAPEPATTGERDESLAAPGCPVCRTPLRCSGTAGPARYCSAACRQQAARG